MVLCDGLGRAAVLHISLSMYVYVCIFLLPVLCSLDPPLQYLHLYLFLYWTFDHHDVAMKHLYLTLPPPPLHADPCMHRLNKTVQSSRGSLTRGDRERAAAQRRAHAKSSQSQPSVLHGLIAATPLPKVPPFH